MPWCANLQLRRLRQKMTGSDVRMVGELTFLVPGRPGAFPTLLHRFPKGRSKTVLAWLRLFTFAAPVTTEWPADMQTVAVIFLMSDCERYADRFTTIWRRRRPFFFDL